VCEKDFLHSSWRLYDSSRQSRLTNDECGLYMIVFIMRNHVTLWSNLFLLILLRQRFNFNTHLSADQYCFGISPNSHREWSEPFALKKTNVIWSAATAHTAKDIAFVEVVNEIQRKRRLPCYNPMYSYVLVVHNLLNKECMLWS